MRSLSSQFNFSEKKDFKHLLKWFLLFIAIYSVLGVFQHRAELGFFPDEVKNHVLGNSNEFTPALNLGELAEILHIRLFLINLILLILFSSFKSFCQSSQQGHSYDGPCLRSMPTRSTIPAWTEMDFSYFYLHLYSCIFNLAVIYTLPVFVPH